MTLRSRFIPITRLERHVLAELIESFGVAIAAFTLLILVAGAYEPVREGLPLGSLAKFLPLMIPHALPWTIPTAFVAACIMVYSRMAGSNELTAVRASGIHLWRVLTPVVLLGVLLSALCGVLNHEWAPRVRFYQYNLVRSASASEQANALRFSDPVMRIGNVVVYMGEINTDDSFRDVVIVMKERILGTVENERAETQITYVRAPRGHFVYSDERSEIVFHLESDPAQNTARNPHAGACSLCKVVYGTSPRDFERARFMSGTFPVRLESMSALDLLPHRPKFMTTAELLLKTRARGKEIARSRRKGPDTANMTASDKAYAEKKWSRWVNEPRYWRMEIHERSAHSLAPLLLGALAIPLGVMTRRGQRIVAFALAIAVVLGGYYPLTAGASALGDSGMLSPPVAAWSVPVVVAGAALVLIRNMLRQ